MILFLVLKLLIAINTCLDEMKEFKGKDKAITYVTVFLSPLVTERSKEFWLPNLSLSYYGVKTTWYVFTPQFHC